MGRSTAKASIQARGGRRGTWHVYIVRCRDGSLYTGIATDVSRRLSEHETPGGKGAKYLRGRGPLRLLLVRPASSREAALRLERRIKRLPKSRKEELVKRPIRFDRWAALLDVGTGA